MKSSKSRVQIKLKTYHKMLQWNHLHGENRNASVNIFLIGKTDTSIILSEAEFGICFQKKYVKVNIYVANECIYFCNSNKPYWFLTVCLVQNKTINYKLPLTLEYKLNLWKIKIKKKQFTSHHEYNKEKVKFVTEMKFICC